MKLAKHSKEEVKTSKMGGGPERVNLHLSESFLPFSTSNPHNKCRSSKPRRKILTLDSPRILVKTTHNKIISTDCRRKG